MAVLLNITSDVGRPASVTWLWLTSGIHAWAISLFIRHVQAAECKINYLQHAKTKQISVVNFTCSRCDYFSKIAVFYDQYEFDLIILIDYNFWVVTSYRYFVSTLRQHNGLANVWTMSYKAFSYLSLRGTFCNLNWSAWLPTNRWQYRGKRLSN